MRWSVGSVVLAGALICTPLLASAQSENRGVREPDVDQGNNQNMSRMTEAERNFIGHAAAGGVAEVQLGQLAVNKASNEQVKKFGERMMREHAQVNRELVQLATRDDIQIPKRLDAKDEDLRRHLESLSGNAFDRAYMQSMVQDHKQDVEEFERESQSGHNADVKEFATQTLPALKSHLEEAERIAGQLQR